MVGLLEASRYSYGCLKAPPPPPVFVRLDCYRPPGIRRDGLLEATRFSYGWPHRGLPVFVWLKSEASRISYGWTLRGPPVSVYLNSLIPFGFRTVRHSEAPRFGMVGLLDAPRYSYGWTLKGPPVFVLLDS